MGGIVKTPRPFNRWTTYPGHVGIDYPEPDDLMVKASGNGRVTFSGWFSDAAGYGVSVSYDNGTVQSYKHSDAGDWRIAVGQNVKLGSNLMEVGGTGQGSTGPHLHHEVFVNGVIQKDANYWKYVDNSPNGYVGAPNNSGNKAKTVMEKLEMKFIYLRPNNNSTIYKINLETMRSRPLKPKVWESVVASYEKLGLKDPLATYNASQESLLVEFPAE